jgi:hypothetical protein
MKRFDEEYQALFSHLKELNYSRRTLNRYRNHHEDVMSRLKANGRENEQFDSRLCEWLVQDIIGEREFYTLSCKEKNEINSLQAILSYSETGSLSLFGRPNKVLCFDGSLSAAIKDYLEHDRVIGRTQGTIRIKSLYLTYMKDYFVNVMGLQSWEELTKIGLFSYVESLVRYSPPMISQFLSLLRGFLAYLFEQLCYRYMLLVMHVLLVADSLQEQLTVVLLQIVKFGQGHEPVPAYGAHLVLDAPLFPSASRVTETYRKPIMCPELLEQL